MPEGFPLDPVDRHNCALSVGDTISILSVDSCAKGLPLPDQEHLRSLVGKLRKIVEFDAYGFVWLSFTASELEAGFSLFPNEVARVHDT